MPGIEAPPASRRLRLRLSAVLVSALVAFLACAGLAFQRYCATPAALTETVTVVIPKGAGRVRVGEILAGKGLIKNDWRYFAWLRIHGRGKTLKAGVYSFKPPEPGRTDASRLTPPEILNRIAAGEADSFPLTIVEGLRLEQIADVLAREGWADRNRFLALCRDKDFVASLKLEGLPAGRSLEGYRFPDTYCMTRGMGEKAIIRRMVQRFVQVWGGLPRDKAALSRHEVLTLASIVEKETGAAPERPLIARVFLNRLEKKMPLQSDPTTLYGLGPDFKGRLTKAHLRERTSHNTYVIPALPPGPICSPGRAALAAVLEPAETEALYFVSKNDGTHVFSKTLAEHNRAVNRYQRRKREADPHNQAKKNSQ